MRIAKSNQLRRLLQTQDVLLSVLGMAVFVDLLWVVGVLPTKAVVSHFNLLAFVAALSFAASVSYSPRLHHQSFANFLGAALRHAGIVTLGLAFILTLTGVDEPFNFFLGAYFVLLTSILLGNRLFLRWWYLEGRREHRSNYLKVIVVGSGRRAMNLIRSYKTNEDWSIEVVACVEPDKTYKPRLPADLQLIHGLDDFSELLAKEVVDEVVICLPRRMLGDIDPVLTACEEQGICIKFMADLHDAATDRYSLESVGEVPILNVDPVLQGTGQLVAKRLVDLVATVAILALLWPLFIIIAIAIKLDSPGPVFFVQRRVGLNKRPFQMYKFRSMRQDAESLMDELEALNEAQGPIFKIENDPRITRVGRFLRRSSMDELPQLLNIALGHMSLIGPRPMSERDVEKFDKGIQQRRFSVRPGLACLREVQGRSALSFERWLELDLQYIDTWSFALDMKIMLRLIPIVLSGKGAS